MPDPTTRLAPSPTGALHLGNARTFMINWAIARHQQQRVILRIEDLDGPRIKPHAAQAAIDDLTWLGIDWDGPPIYQRHDLTPYNAALQKLTSDGRTYPCTCTRKQILSALSAPHQDDHETRYPNTCRPTPGTIPSEHDAQSDDTTPTALRIIVPDEPITFTDHFHGPQSFNVQQQVGDFIVATKTALPAYQLAVVVDDARQSVTHITRGDDLLRSTARQLWLYRCLDLTPIPHYTHLPLVLGPDGRRLAKRHGDTRLATYRQATIDPHRITGLLAHWSGITDHPTPMTAQDFKHHFNLDRLPRTPVRFTQDHHHWLTTQE